MTRKHIEVVAAIIQKGNAILATQRGYGDLKDGWEFPGGKRLITVNYNGYEKFDLTMHCYMCTLTEDSYVTLLEHEAAKWLTKETLYSVDWLSADIEAVDALYTRL